MSQLIVVMPFMENYFNQPIFQIITFKCHILQIYFYPLCRILFKGKKIFRFLLLIRI